MLLNNTPTYIFMYYAGETHRPLLVHQIVSAKPLSHLLEMTAATCAVVLPECTRIVVITLNNTDALITSPKTAVYGIAQN